MESPQPFLPVPFQLGLWCLGAFLCGSIPFGLIVVKLLGQGDVRSKGSGNIGATNVSRVAGKGAGILVLLLDVAKGIVPVFLARKAGIAESFLPWIGFGAVAGHVFSPLLRFKGGKGVATAFGIVLAVHWRLGALPLAFFVAALWLTRHVSLGSILAALMLPLEVVLLALSGPYGGFRALGEHAPYLMAWTSIAVLVIAKHHENIRRLQAGTESKLWGPAPEDGTHA
ncbi:MAG: glycerol-3-phosphate 1-O-acyltransferase PlsY [Holophagaceae bacterium]|nr:glycerol-3-phosphate 1-O-acyltransferase PlsY [Holophagaceae bacterium]